MKTNNITSRLEVSYLEIYNEQCRDLLKKRSKVETPQLLKVREHPKEGPFVEGKGLCIIPYCMNHYTPNFIIILKFDWRGVNSWSAKHMFAYILCN